MQYLCHIFYIPLLLDEVEKDVTTVRCLHQGIYQFENPPRWEVAVSWLKALLWPKGYSVPEASLDHTGICTTESKCAVLLVQTGSHSALCEQNLSPFKFDTCHLQVM